jgi:hypothetical protein
MVKRGGLARPTSSVQARHMDKTPRAKAKVKYAKRVLQYPCGYIHRTGYVSATVCFLDDEGNWQAGYKYAHRMVMEFRLKRKLSSDEYVHHIDHDKLNNSWQNLSIISKQDHNAQALAAARRAQKSRKLVTA